VENRGDYSDLIEAIHESLRRYRYTEREELQLRDVGSVHLVMTKRRRMVRYLCAVVDTAQRVSTKNECKRLLQRLREGLSVQFARFPYFKELGTFVVLLCSPAAYESLSQRPSAFYDLTGCHINVMLGAILVDRCNFKVSAGATWSLYYSGKHFRAIERTVEQWCQAKRGSS
jgi:hypothetical protein